MQQSERPERPVRLSERLRAETAEAHHQLDSQTALAVLMRPDLSPASYGLALFCLYQAWAPAEQTIEQLLKECSADPAVSQLACYYFPRRQALEADLAELTGVLPRCDDRRLAERNVPPKAILAGQLYVLAGGQLGSVLIERRISAANPALPLRFFQARPADLGQRWAGFRECLDTLFASPDTQGPVIEAANLMFQQFTEKMEAAARSQSVPAP